MDDTETLAARFEENRNHLRAVAYRMLGSLSEADDAVQDAWLRVSRADTTAVENLTGWLTTVVARICLTMLRARKSRYEEPMDAQDPIASRQAHGDAEEEAVLADSVGLALLVVLDKLTPAERLAFVLHDMFDLPFDEIAPIVGRSEVATRQLASRARRRVRGGTLTSGADLASRRTVVDAYLAASRGGNFEALLDLLDPDVLLRVDDSVIPGRISREIRGAQIVATQALRYPERARFAQVVLINGNPGVIVAPRGRLLVALQPTVSRGQIVAIDVVTNAETLRQLDLALFAE